MLSYEKAKTLVKEHEEVEQTLTKLKEEREAIDAQILAQELRLTEIEGEFRKDEAKKYEAPEIEEAPDREKKTHEEAPQEPKGIKPPQKEEKIGVPEDLPVGCEKAPEIGRKTSIYRIKGGK